MNGCWRRRNGRIGRLAGLLVAACAALPAGAQGAAAVERPAPAAWTAATSDADGARGMLIREIDDESCGVRWLLLRDDRHPGGPGRLVAAANAEEHAPVAPAARSERPLIRAGDRIVLEQETPEASARLGAVALGPAMAGRRFRARLKIGGKVVEALALTRGRAMLEPEELP